MSVIHDSHSSTNKKTAMKYTWKFQNKREKLKYGLSRETLFRNFTLHEIRVAHETEVGSEVRYRNFYKMTNWQTSGIDKAYAYF